MKFIRLLFLLLFLAGVGHPGNATEYSPWFTPLFECDTRFSYQYAHIEKFNSQSSNFSLPSHHHTCYASVGITPWPYWNIEGELFLTHSSQISCSYEASGLTLRYNWLDDGEGAPCSLVTGATALFPGNPFLHDVGFLYLASAQCEWHLTIGKEWYQGRDWKVRLWGLGGYGLALKGSPWLRALGWVEFKPRSCCKLALFGEGLWGLGHSSLILLDPFPGYASIHYQRVNLGGEMRMEIGYLGDLTLRGWHNLHARNCMFHDWGIQLSLLLILGLL